MKIISVVALTAVLAGNAFADETVLSGKEAQDAFFAGTEGVRYSEDFENEVRAAFSDPLTTGANEQNLFKLARIAGIEIKTCDDGGDDYIASLNKRVVVTRTVDDEGNTVARREAGCEK